MSTLIRSFGQLENTDLAPDAPIVTLFSGGLDSTYLLHRLRRMGMTNIHAVSVDVGDIEPHEGKREIAARLGAQFHSVDAREEFLEHHVAPAIKAHAVYLGVHPISSSLSRPLLARVALDVAENTGASVILHTANRSQNSLRRLNGALAALPFDGLFGSPYDLEPVDRSTKLEELMSAGLSAMAQRVVSGDSNLWCREYESGFLDDPENHTMERDLYQWTATPAGAIADEVLSIEFDRGIAVALDGRRMSLGAIVEELNRRVGRFGYGRYSGLEHLDRGQKVLEVREMPAAWMLLKTLRHLETACLSERLIREKLTLEQTWVTEAVEGRWFGAHKAAAQAFIDAAAERVSGTVIWSLGQRSADTVSIIAREPLYLRDRDTWEIESVMSERVGYAGLPLASSLPVVSNG